MMTVKEFASLCLCSTQTLRYYDKIDLLKPIKVDPWSGYRYYESSQAIDFVKIKNLQAADFTIDEIKTLLTLPDSRVYEAFERKIEEQTQKLTRIKEIQQSYLTEKSAMEKLIQNATNYILHAVSDFSILQEFGLSPEEGPVVVSRLKDYFERKLQQQLPKEPDIRMIVNDQVIRGAERVADTFAALQEDGYDGSVFLGDETVQESELITEGNSETVWECHGWNFVHEFLDQIPTLERDCEYCFSFSLAGDKYRESMEFPMFMIASMILRANADEITMGCRVERSEDEGNHFALLRKK